MDDEKEKAFAHFDALKASVTELHGHATRTGDAALEQSVNEHHAALELAWQDYLGRRGWAEEAAVGARSGGEGKPPRNDPGVDPDGGEG